MRYWAEISRVPNFVRNISEHEHDPQAVAPMYAIEVTGMNPMPQKGWYYDGTQFYTEPPPYDPLTGGYVEELPDQHRAAQKADAWVQTLQAMDPTELQAFIQSKIPDNDLAKMLYVLFTNMLK